LGGWTFEQRNVLQYARNILASAQRGVPELADVTVQSALEDLPRARQAAEKVMATQNEGGVWMWGDNKTDLSPGDVEGPRRFDSIGSWFRVENSQVRTILRYIELARMVAGEIPVERRGYGVLRADAYPYTDWWDLDWEARSKRRASPALVAVPKGDVHREKGNGRIDDYGGDSAVPGAHLGAGVVQSSGHLVAGARRADPAHYLGAQL